MDALKMAIMKRRGKFSEDTDNTLNEERLKDGLAPEVLDLDDENMQVAESSDGTPMEEKEIELEVSGKGTDPQMFLEDMMKTSKSDLGKDNTIAGKAAAKMKAALDKLRG